jgi:hypothetical protein
MTKTGTNINKRVFTNVCIKTLKKQKQKNFILKTLKNKRKNKKLYSEKCLMGGFFTLKWIF